MFAPGKFRATAFAVLAGLAVAWPCAADVIFDNGILNYGGGYNSDLNDDWPPVYSRPSQAASDFVLAAGATAITDVHWGGMYNEYMDPDPGAGIVDDFTIFFYEESGGNPGSLVAQYHAGAAARTPDLFHNEELRYYTYDYDLPSALVLEAGRTYFIAIANDTVSPYSWFWGVSGPGQCWVMWLSDGVWLTGWEDDCDRDLAFQLTGERTGDVVPEPATLSLLGLGLSGLVVRRWKRRSA